MLGTRTGRAPTDHQEPQGASVRLTDMASRSRELRALPYIDFDQICLSIVISVIANETTFEINATGGETRMGGASMKHQQDQLMFGQIYRSQKYKRVHTGQPGRCFRWRTSYFVY